MHRSRGRVVEVDTVEELRRRLDRGARSLRGWRLRGLDLTDGNGELLAGRLDVHEATFVGCAVDAALAQSLLARGALLLPATPDSPLDTDRDHLYTAEELYDAPRYADSTDARAYAWSQQPGDAATRLARALHDHAIDSALETWVADRRLVGVMGGHALERDDLGFADAARLGRLLGREHTVATGGGPGAMEAANLGGRLAGHDDDGVLEEALERLARVPSFRPSVDAWLDAARAALEVADGAGRQARPGLGIPTWHYGHEPANVFATAIAKYLRNATREAILLEVCHAGIVFLPGSGGTVQEVFQDACENYYADESSVAPMVLVGRRYWTEELPAWPLLRSLARGRVMEPHVHLVDTVDEAAAVIAG